MNCFCGKNIIEFSLYLKAHKATVLFGIALALYVGFIAKLFLFFKNCLASPIVRYDYAFHYANAKNFTSYLRDYFNFWGYNPFIGGGWLETGGASSKAITLLFLFVPKSFEAQAYNIIVFTILISLPFLFMFAVSLFTQKKGANYLAFSFCALFLIGNSMGQEFILVGHYGYLLGTLFSFIAAGFFWKYMHHGITRHVFFQALFCGLAVWTHLLMPITIGLLYLPLILFSWKKLSNRIIKGVCVSLLPVLIPNMTWVYRILSVYVCKERSYQNGQFLQTGWAENITNLSDPVLAVTIVFFMLLLFESVRKNKHLIIGELIVSIISMFLLSLFGTQIGLENIQPSRNIIPFALLMFFYIGLTSKRKSYILIIFLLIISGFRAANYKPYVGCGFQAAYADTLFSFIDKRISTKSRISIEDCHGLTPLRSRFAYFIAEELKVPVLNKSFIYPNSFTQFIDGVVFDTSLDTIDYKKIRTFADMYNVEFFLSYTDKSKEHFMRSPYYEPVFSAGDYVVFQAKNFKRSYCFECEADISFSKKSIIVKNASSETTILKFNYVPSLRAYPSNIKISPYALSHDSSERFIRVENKGIRKFEICNRKKLFYK